MQTIPLQMSKKQFLAQNDAEREQFLDEALIKVSDKYGAVTDILYEKVPDQEDVLVIHFVIEGESKECSGDCGNCGCK